MVAQTWSQRKAIASDLIQTAIQSVDPYNAVKSYLHLDGQLLHAGKQIYDLSQIERVVVGGAGKAAAPMAAAVEDVLGDRISAGFVNVKYGYGGPTRIIEVNEGGHPLPDEQGMLGARRMAEMLESAGKRDLVINLVSGGGSALLVLPAEGLTLDDKQRVTDLLLRSGATINEINAIRKHLSASKGGNWARLAQPAQMISLILSDVVGNPLDVISSGPTVPDSSTFSEACQILEKYGLMDRVPTSVMQRLCLGRDHGIAENPGLEDSIFEKVNNVLVGSNEIAARAALARADTSGFNTMLLSTYVEGEAREVARVITAIAKEVVHSASPLARPACIVLGGETTVTIKGKGRGGRNQELALAAAIGLEGLDEALVISLATDGSDGPTDAAGAIVSGSSIERALLLGLDARAFLADNNSYEFFQRLGDLIITGPTNTNVNDLMFVLVF
jgi:hydroxypyruvate reductase